MFRTSTTPDPVFTETLTLDLAEVVPSLAGPKRPEGPRRAAAVAEGFAAAMETEYKKAIEQSQRYAVDGRQRRPRPWRRGDRGDHLLHQHLEPERADRRGPARAQCRRQGLEGEAVGEDLARAGQPGGRRVSRQFGPAEGSRQGRLQPGRLRLHHLHRQFRPAAGGDLRRRSTTTASSPRPCCRATATSKAASARTCRRTISPRRRWWSPTRLRARCSIEPRRTSRSAPARTASRCT